MVEKYVGENLSDSLEMGTERKGDQSGWSAAELGMRLGDWIWRREGGVKVWGLPTCFPSDQLPSGKRDLCLVMYL